MARLGVNPSQVVCLVAKITESQRQPYADLVLNADYGKQTKQSINTRVTQPNSFTISGLPNPPIAISGLHKVRRSTDFKALKIVERPVG